MTTKIPGTVQLVDIEGVLNVKHGSGDRELVLVPQPSDHPDDPLQWTQKRKLFNIFWAMTWCFFAAAIISGLSPAYLLIEADTGISVADLSTGNGLMFLFLGWGTLLTQSLALNYGRRLTLVVSIVLTTVVTLWSAYVKSRGEFFANRIILGIVSSPMETLIEVIIGDIFFVHDRGFYMGIYCWTLWCGALLCPVVSGFVAGSFGWRWIQYILACIGGAVSVLTYVFFEETMFYRSSTQLDIIGVRDELSTPPDDSGFPTKVSSPEAEKQQGDTTGHSQTSTSCAQDDEVPRDVQSRTRTQHFKMWGYNDPRASDHFQHFFLPFVLLRYPVVIFAGLLVGGILSWYNVVGGSLALILGNQPYGFSSNTVGLFYLASVIGVSIGCFVSGWMSDVLTIWIARKKKGVMEPEYRLWMCIAAIIAHPVGCLLYGVGASYNIHWVGIAFGLGLISITLPIGSSLALTYILDSYKEVAGEALVSAILIRNLMGFAFSYAVVPMIENLTLRYSFVLISLLGSGLWCCCLLMLCFGKAMRRASAESYWRLLETHGIA